VSRVPARSLRRFPLSNASDPVAYAAIWIINLVFRLTVTVSVAASAIGSGTQPPWYQDIRYFADDGLLNPVAIAGGNGNDPLRHRSGTQPGAGRVVRRDRSRVRRIAGRVVLRGRRPDPRGAIPRRASARRKRTDPRRSRGSSLVPQQVPTATLGRARSRGVLDWSC
jgi:hypothetical protein